MCINGVCKFAQSFSCFKSSKGKHLTKCSRIRNGIHVISVEKACQVISLCGDTRRLANLLQENESLTIPTMYQQNLLLPTMSLLP